METFKVSKKNVLILIPARFQSTRFPGKPLALIAGETMISRVFKNCQTARDANINFETFVVTDNEKIEAHVKTFSNNVVRVDDDVLSGTLRIELAYRRFFQDKNCDLIINVQGDEPLLSGDEIVSLSQFHFKNSFDISTLVKKEIAFDDLFFDTNKVKVVFSEKTKKIFYFSRAGIPLSRENVFNENENYWHLHVGVYAYKPEALRVFSNAPISHLENLEKLEQLRALEVGLSIGAHQIEKKSIGVDHPEDIKKIEEVLCGRN